MSPRPSSSPRRGAGESLRAWPDKSRSASSVCFCWRLLEFGDAASHRLLGVAYLVRSRFSSSSLELALKLVLDPVLVLLDELFGLGRCAFRSGTACLHHVRAEPSSRVRYKPRSRRPTPATTPAIAAGVQPTPVPRPRPAITPAGQQQKRPDERHRSAGTWEA